MPNNTVPLETKIKRGTARQDRVPANIIKPFYLVELPIIPKKYKDLPEAKKKYKKICQYLLNEKRLTEPDLEQIELLTDAFIEYNNAWEKIQTLKSDSAFIKSQFNQGGQEYESLTQYWSVYKTTIEIVRKISNDLGLTSASRAKVGLPSGKQEENAAQTLRNALLGGSLN